MLLMPRLPTVIPTLDPGASEHEARSLLVSSRTATARSATTGALKCCFTLTSRTSSTPRPSSGNRSHSPHLPAARVLDIGARIRARLSTVASSLTASRPAPLHPPAPPGAAPLRPDRFRLRLGPVQRASYCCLRTDVQHDGARGRAAYPAVRDPDHVPHPPPEEFIRYGQ